MTPLIKVYFYECHHSNSYARPLPQVGETAFCRMCHDYRIVSALGVFAAICDKKSCTFTRTNRPDLESGIETDRKHIKMRPTHTVTVREDDTAVYYVAHLEEGPISVGAALVQASHDAQKILKNFQETLDAVLPGEEDSSHDDGASHADSDQRNQPSGG